MTNSLERIFDGMIDVLQSRVIPSIAEEFARGQAYGALDLLRNLKPRVEWAVGPLYDDVAAGLALARRIAALLEGAEPKPPEAPAENLERERLTATDLEPMRDRLDAHLTEVLRWLGAHPGAVPAGRADEVESVIRKEQRARLKREVKLTAPTLFGEISRGQ